MEILETAPSANKPRSKVCKHIASTRTRTDVGFVHILRLQTLSSRRSWATAVRPETRIALRPGRRAASSCVRCSRARTSPRASRAASRAAPPPACALRTRVPPRDSARRFRSRAACFLAGNHVFILKLRTYAILFIINLRPFLLKPVVTARYLIDLRARRNCLSHSSNFSLTCSKLKR